MIYHNTNNSKITIIVTFEGITMTHILMWTVDGVVDGGDEKGIHYIVYIVYNLLNMG